MAQFNNMKLTSKGILLMNKVQTGIPLNFTKVGIGDGYLANGQQLEDLNDLIHKILDLDINNIDVNSSGDGTVKIRTSLSNQDLITGIYVREIGLYANDPDNGEILYCVANAGNTADFIPGKGSDIIENILEVITITGNASNVTATIDQSLVFTSQKEFSEKVGDVTELPTGKVVEELKSHASQLADITQQELPLKVDKIEGKGLSTNDYDNIQKAEVSKVKDKADQSFVDSQFAAIVSGAPKGTFIDLATLQTTYPTGVEGVFLVLANGHWYYWNSSTSQWLDGGVYQATEIEDESITPIKTIFIERGNNLFNKDTAQSGYINYSSGVVETHVTYWYTDFIRINPSTIYTKFNFASTHFAFYDINKQYISNAVNSLADTFTSPSNAYYVRLTLPNSIAKGTAILNQGSSTIPYEPYREKLQNKYVPILDGNNISSRTLEEKHIKGTANLFNKATSIQEKYISEISGLAETNTGYYASDYIEVLPSTTHIATVNRTLAYYDTNKNFISGVSDNPIVNNKTFATPSNAKYLRISIPNDLIDSFMVVNSSVMPSYYIPFGTVLPWLRVAKDNINPDVILDDIKIFLPSEICVAVGRTIELYNDQVIWCGNINNFHVKWDCTIGKAMKRKFSVTGTADLIGEYTLSLTVYNNNMVQVAYAETTVKVVSNIISTNKSVLVLADSLSNNKPWLQEVRNLSNNTITFVGTRGTAPLMHEARSGFGSYDYLHATAYTYEEEGVHPFWDGTRFNWNYYKTNTNVNPDIVQIFLGTNGITVDPTDNANNIKQIVDYIRQDDANIPIYVVYTLYRGNQDGLGVQQNTDGYASNKGAWKLQEDAKVFNLMVKLNELLTNYTNLHFVPISLCHDSEYNFGAVETPVNPRATQTELLPVEATHPQNQGYLQMADIEFSVFAKYHNE